MPFFRSVRIAWVERVIVIFLPSTIKVFFCRFGLKTRFVRRREKLTLLPNCLPLPVSSHFDAMGSTLSHNISSKSVLVYDNAALESRWRIMVSMDLIWQIVTVLGVILVSMTLHEAMHGFMAYYLGDDTAKLQGRLTLNPLKHIDPFLTILLPILLAISGAPIFGGAKPVPFNPARVRYGEWGAALVAVVGPLINLLLAFIIFGVGVISGVITQGGLVEASSMGQIIQTGILVNLGFFIFNMLPIPPLDGSRVLYAIAPDFVRTGMQAIERIGLIVIFAIVLLGSSMLGVFLTRAMVAIISLFTRIFGLN